jgi:hypothetical protein
MAGMGQGLPVAPTGPSDRFGSTPALAGGYQLSDFHHQEGLISCRPGEHVCTPLWVLASLPVRSAIALLLFE